MSRGREVAASCEVRPDGDAVITLSGDDVRASAELPPEDAELFTRRLVDELGIWEELAREPGEWAEAVGEAYAGGNDDEAGPNDVYSIEGEGV